MEALFVKESMNIRWVAETGIVDAIEAVIAEYKETRKLLVNTLCIFSLSLSVTLNFFRVILCFSDAFNWFKAVVAARCQNEINAEVTLIA